MRLKQSVISHVALEPWHKTPRVGFDKIHKAVVLVYVFSVGFSQGFSSQLRGAIASPFLAVDF